MQAVEPPGVHLEGIGHAQQAHRLTGGRGIDNDYLEIALLRVAVDVDEADDLVHAGDEGQLFGQHRVHATLAQQPAHRLLQFAPAAAHLIENVDFLRPQVRRDFAWLGSERTIKTVRQAVRQVGADDKRAFARHGRANGGSGGNGRLPHSALAKIEDNAHTDYYSLISHRHRSVPRCYLHLLLRMRLPAGYMVSRDGEKGTVACHAERKRSI